MKIKISILFLILLISCKDNQSTTKIDDSKLKSSFKSQFQLKLADSLNILTPSENSIEYLDSFIYKDSLFFGVSGSNTIDVYDLKKGSAIKGIKIEKYELKGRVQNIYVKSLDSIYLTNMNPPIIYQINFNGEVEDKIDGGIFDLNIQNDLIPKNVVNYSFPSSVTYQKSQFHGEKMFALLQPIGLTEVEGFRKTERIGVYDFNKGEWIEAICSPKGKMEEEGVFYNYDLMNPYFTVVNNKIYLSYPMDDFVYVYDLKGKLLYSHFASSSDVQKMPEPLNLETLNHRQKSWNFRIQTPFYGPLFYHSKSKLFSRIYYEGQDLYESDGILNRGHKRKAYIAIFNEKMEKIGEKIFEEATLSMGHFTPLSDGLLIGKTSIYWENENEFIQKYIYKFSKI